MKIKFSLLLLLFAGLFLFGQTAQGQSGTGEDESDEHSIYLPLIVKPEVPPPYIGTSYYLQDTATPKIRDLGCRIGNEAFVSDSPVYYTYIHVGQPAKQMQEIDGVEVEVFGMFKHASEASQLPIEFISLEKLQESMLLLAMNAIACLDSDDQLIRLGIGPNNFGSEITIEQGAQWGSWIESLQAEIDGTGASGVGGMLLDRVQIVGAVDIEIGFNGPQETKDWVNGYYSTGSILYNMGTLDGCPSKFAPDFTCGTVDYPTWTLDDVEEIFDHLGARAIPQIYDDSGVTAGQWVVLAQRRKGNSQFPFRLVGALSQEGACQQRGGCEGIDNTPEEAFGKLLFQLNEADTFPQTLDFVTDILWQID